MRAEAEILVHPCHQVLAAHEDTRLAHFGALARFIVVSPAILDDDPLETLPYQRLEESFVSVFSALLPRNGEREKEDGVTNNRIFFVTRNNRGKTPWRRNFCFRVVGTDESWNFNVLLKLWMKRWIKRCAIEIFYQRLLRFLLLKKTVFKKRRIPSWMINNSKYSLNPKFLQAEIRKR